MKVNRNIFVCLAWLFCVFCLIGQCWAETLSLAGKWNVRLDPGNVGIKEKWFDKTFEMPITLPASLDEARVSPKVDERVLDRLSRDHKYIGVAWYERTVRIPEEWRGKMAELFLERVMWQTRVWVDGKEISTAEDSLCVPHVHPLGVLNPGDHHVVIRVDNSQQYDLGDWSHGYSEMIQSRWNGMTGRLELRATPLVYIEDVQVFPNVGAKKIKVNISIANQSGAAGEGNIGLVVGTADRPSVEKRLKVNWTAQGGKTECEINLGTDARLWDEFEPNLYSLEVQLDGESGSDTRRVTFGLRDFSTDKSCRQFVINGRPVMMRGTHDAGCFPLTGYPSSNVDDWLRICRIVKSYGLNHIRFHSWTPPEAAFVAADQTGVYLQTELPLFSIHSSPIGKDDARDKFLERELKRLLKEYGNHPSFCFMAMGNELFGDFVVLDKFVAYGRSTDPRHLYTCSSNPEMHKFSNPGAAWYRPRQGEQYLVAHSGISEGKRFERRASPWSSFNNVDGETIADYGFTLPVGVPVISHEVGQCYVYPNYDEIPKYSGVQKARNFELWRETARTNGVLENARDIFHASGMFALMFYRDEIERQLRTPGYGGFQLLDLRDYPGQDSALVGILDAFWDSKGLIKPEEWSRFCGPTVILARLAKRNWVPGETFAADVDLAHYGAKDMAGVKAVWRLRDEAGKTISEGAMNSVIAKTGGLTRLGRCETVTPKVVRASHWNLSLELEGTEVANDWSVWIFPAAEPRLPEDVLVTEDWKTARTRLENGGKVLWLAQGSPGAGPKENAHWQIRFATPFWNCVAVPGLTRSCGLLIRNRHPAFAGFPTDDHADWQWKEIQDGASRMSLVELPKTLDPIVWVIDSPLFNHRQAALCEARYGTGRLMACSLNLKGDLSHKPAASCLKQSLLDYMASEKFNPTINLSGVDLPGKLFPLPNEQSAAPASAPSHVSGSAPE